MQRKWQPTRIKVDFFWASETFWGYEVALKLTAEKFGTTCEQVEALTIEDDALNAGNG